MELGLWRVNGRQSATVVVPHNAFAEIIGLNFAITCCITSPEVVATELPVDLVERVTDKGHC